MFRAGMNTSSDPLSLLKQVLITRNPELLQQLRKRADEVTAALDASDDEPFTEIESRTIAEDPQWLAQVYDVLGCEEDATAHESELEAAIDEIHRNQDREIAEAFQILVGHLPADLREWRLWFGRLAQISQASRETLCQRWSELCADASTLELTRYGMTPATFFEAVVGLQLLLERCMEDSRERADSVFLLEFETLVDEYPAKRGHVSLRYRQVLAQIRSSPDCPPGAEEALLRWTCLAAARRPRMFQGFKVLAVVSGSVLGVVHDPGNENTDLLHRWTYEPERQTEDGARYRVSAKVANTAW